MLGEVFRCCFDAPEASSKMPLDWKTSEVDNVMNTVAEFMADFIIFGLHHRHYYTITSKR